jgi:hypothetical protein
MRVSRVPPLMMATRGQLSPRGSSFPKGSSRAGNASRGAKIPKVMVWRGHTVGRKVDVRA